MMNTLNIGCHPTLKNHQLLAEDNIPIVQSGLKLSNSTLQSVDSSADS